MSLHPDHTPHTPEAYFERYADKTPTGKKLEVTSSLLQRALALYLFSQMTKPQRTLKVNDRFARMIPEGEDGVKVPGMVMSVSPEMLTLIRLLDYLHGEKVNQATDVLGWLAALILPSGPLHRSLIKGLYKGFGPSEVQHHLETHHLDILQRTAEQLDKKIKENGGKIRVDLMHQPVKQLYTESIHSFLVPDIESSDISNLAKLMVELGERMGEYLLTVIKQEKSPAFLHNKIGATENDVKQHFSRVNQVIGDLKTTHFDPIIKGYLKDVNAGVFTGEGKDGVLRKMVRYFLTETRREEGQVQYQRTSEKIEKIREEVVALIINQGKVDLKVLEHYQHQSDEDFIVEAMESFLTSVIFAGQDTVTMLTTNAVLIANANPTILANCRQEILQALGLSEGQRISREQFMELLGEQSQSFPYLEALLTESLRLRPPVDNLIRSFQNEDGPIHIRYGGNDFKGGTLNVLIGPMQRRPEHFVKPHRAEPNRHLSDEVIKAAGYNWTEASPNVVAYRQQYNMAAYAPFGAKARNQEPREISGAGNARNCPG
ncbi:MAG TPA: cytochrome P450, partial [Patescibacteria group bacterium]